MTRQNSTALVLMSVLLTLSAGPARAQDARAQRAESLRAQVVDTETRSLSLGPRGELALSNFAGDITIRTTSGEDVTLTIVRRARGRTEADARRGLERVVVRVDERARRATVESSHGSERNPPYSVSVAYEVSAPAGTSVDIHTLTGNIEAAGLAGELTAETTTGDISVRDSQSVSRARSATGRVALANVGTSGTMEAGTIAGDVELDGVRARRLVIGTVSGGVTARDARAERAEVTSTAGDIEYAGEIMPDGRYELRTHAGTLRFIAVGGSGFELRASTFVGRISPDTALDLKAIRQDARELVGTVGDGRALVTLASFSGGITIERR